MKEIIAVIRPNQWQKTKSALFEAGFNAITVHRVYGRGKQKGLRYLSKTGNLEEGIVFLPKRMITIFAKDEEVELVLKIIEQTNKTGSIGDGKIFVLRLEEALRVRTGEKGDCALQ